MTRRLRAKRLTSAMPSGTVRSWTTLIYGSVSLSAMSDSLAATRWPPTEAAHLMVGAFPAVGFGDVLTSDPAFGVPAFRTLVSPILYVGKALKGCRARQHHRSRAFRAGRSNVKARNAGKGFLGWHTPTPAHITLDNGSNVH